TRGATACAFWVLQDGISYLLFFFFAGTLAPFLRASDRPMAPACLGLVTFLPDLPLFSLPCLNSRMASWTVSCAFGLYFLVIVFSSASACDRPPRASGSYEKI